MENIFTNQLLSGKKSVEFELFNVYIGKNLEKYFLKPKLYVKFVNNNKKVPQLSWLEQKTHNFEVTGSIPVGTTKCCLLEKEV